MNKRTKELFERCGGHYEALTPAGYINCFKENGPNILSSISKNCGTLNCIPLEIGSA